MKVYVRRWKGNGTYEVVATLRIGMYEGLSFRQLPQGEEPATAVNLRGVRVTEIYLCAGEDALTVYVEPLEGKVI
jgi:hypothetical protein